MFSFIKRHWVASLVILLNVLAICVVVGAIVFHNAKNASVDIYVAPAEATIELNGKQYENFQSYDILPGDYHVVISMEGMQTKEFDFTLDNDGFYKIRTYLLDADGGFDYYRTHLNDETILAEVANDAASKRFVEDFEKMYSINDILPLTYSNTYEENATEIVSISIRAGYDDECEDDSFCLIISDYTGKNHDKALAMIRDAGYNPDDYEIIFKEGLEE